MDKPSSKLSIADTLRDVWHSGAGADVESFGDGGDERLANFDRLVARAEALERVAEHAKLYLIHQPPACGQTPICMNYWLLQRSLDEVFQ